jgi:D-glycero-alpha-D-manno-heptose 1-phosphate guanylyltransferase
MGKECIILAGGQGTRLRPIVNELPKCLAPIGNQPFLHYLLTYLQKFEFTHIVFALGYLHEQIELWLQTIHYNFKTSCVIEKVALGTGGAIKLALNSCSEREITIVNGDTFFEIDFNKLEANHYIRDANISIGLKPLKDFSRYGTVSLNEKAQIIGFHEKAQRKEGLINGGIYIINKSVLDEFPAEINFSFETDFLQRETALKNIYGYSEDSYFIDIGIPSDYERAQRDLPQII